MKTKPTRLDVLIAYVAACNNRPLPANVSKEAHDFLAGYERRWFKWLENRIPFMKLGPINKERLFRYAPDVAHEVPECLYL